MPLKRWIVLNVTIALLLFALLVASMHAPPIAFNCKPFPVAETRTP